MQHHEIEAWALRIIRQVEAGFPHEDARVELKADWIEPKKAARRIAGHANAARGAPILWLIGLDEKTGVSGTTHEALASWYPMVKAEFNGLPPSMIDLNVPYKDKVVVALLFETGRAPFLIKNPSYGQKGVAVSLEVPWREGTDTRTADRSELLTLLSPLSVLPDVEVMRGFLIATHTNAESESNEINLDACLDLYVSFTDHRMLVFPSHRCSLRIWIGQQGLDSVTPSLRGEVHTRVERAAAAERGVMLPKKPIHATSTELIAEMPGVVYATISQAIHASRIPPLDDTVRISLSLGMVGVTAPVLLDATLQRRPIDFTSRKLWGVWTFNRDVSLAEYRDEPTPPLPRIDF